MIRVLLLLLCLLAAPAYGQRAAFTWFKSGNSVSPTTYPLIRWFSATSYSQSDGTILATDWIDLAGKSNLTNAAGKQPSFFVNIYGSLPAVRFTNNNYLAMSTTNLEICTVAIVTKNMANPGFYIMSGPGASQYIINDQGDGFPNIQFFSPQGGGVISSTISESITAARVNWLTYNRNTGATTFRVNKTAYGSTTSGLSGFLWNRFGEDINKTKGDIGEIIVWFGVRTVAEMDALYDGYFKPRWGLP